jgi:hypothetical protein
MEHVPVRTSSVNTISAHAYRPSLEIVVQH